MPLATPLWLNTIRQSNLAIQTSKSENQRSLRELVHQKKLTSKYYFGVSLPLPKDNQKRLSI